MTSTTGPSPSRTPLWRDLRVLRIVSQVVAVGVVGFVLWVLWNNLTTNLAAQGLRTDFAFLDQPFGVTIADSGLSPNAPIRSALWVGVKNTFAVVVVGIPLLTIIGVIVGVARLSPNWLAQKAATVYVEVFRNLPPLLIIVFAFRTVILSLPRPTESATPFDLFVINNLRISVPSFKSAPGFETFWLVMAGALVVAAVVWWGRTRRFVATGQPHHRVLWSVAILLGVALVAYVALDRPVRWSIPTLDGRVVVGGFSGLGSYFAVLGALVLYTASHVAEIVRGSIQAVPLGQTEASNALALSGFQRLRFVVLPQAMRTALPPTINQYLNFTKNTSLAIAVAYAEVTLIAFQAIGNGQPAPQLILILMGVYLVFSLVISLLVNILNRRLQLVTR
jgi:general L-amino acid transport system permease protein